ncbi:hypothetical protein FHP29_00590 [Nocardioides albidus]|uniref:Uncharacterized protein n=1 Tax=Nocardioides albidus TaxID=1517589 RepID=A0A5C4WPR1_9ACTN|nr:hypothetical protein FHP29_00590 [Nocardioides albidus]
MRRCPSGGGPAARGRQGRGRGRGRGLRHRGPGAHRQRHPLPGTLRPRLAGHRRGLPGGRRRAVRVCCRGRLR